MSEPSFPPYNVGDLGGDVRRYAPAAARNVVVIGDVLADWLPSEGTVLEVASGSGEHALAFARRFPALQWQPSDPDPTAIASIAAWREGGPGNLLAPLTLDASSDAWPIDRADAIVSINMVHISPWQASLGLIAGAALLLPVGAPLILYGPWREADVPTAPSNEAFDLSLKERDPRWGLRSVDEFAGIAWRHGLVLVDRRSMPANNIMLRFDRQDIGA